MDKSYYLKQLERIRMAYRRHTNRQRVPGILGDADGTVIDPLHPLTNVFVRTYTSNGLSSPRSIFLPSGVNIPLKAGTPVSIGYDFSDRECIVEYDSNAMASVGIPTATTVNSRTSQRIDQGNVNTLQMVADVTQPSMAVRIKAWNPIVNGVVYEFPGDLVTLTAPSAGQMRYGCVFVKSDYATTEVKYSTARSILSLPLGLADAQECVSARSLNSTPVACVKLIGGQTTITQQDIDADAKKLQQLINTLDTTGTAGSIETDEKIWVGCI